MNMAESKTLQPVDMSKTYNRKDWNCPWMSKDGRGMKQAIRAIDEVSAPAKTSQQHFYSEPKSILATEPLLSPEQLQELIREHGQESRPNSSLNMQREENQYEEVRHQEQHQYEMEMETQLQQEMMMQQQQQYQQTTTVQESSMSSSMRQETYCREREEDSQAPPDLEPVALQHQPVAEMVGQQESYEPSADELIDVLKNLENLAAANPALYKSLVGQIKGNAVESHQSFSSNEQQVYYEQQQQQQQQQMESQYYQEESRMMETSSSQEYTSQQEFHQSSTQEYQQQEQHVYENGSVQQEEVQRQVIQESEEERSRRLKMERLEKEVQRQVIQESEEERS